MYLIDRPHSTYTYYSKYLIDRPDSAYSTHHDVSVLPALTHSVSNRAIQRQKRVEVMNRSRVRKERLKWYNNIPYIQASTSTQGYTGGGILFTDVYFEFDLSLFYMPIAPHIT